MEAALRTAAEWLEGKELGSVDFDAVRGFDGVKETTLTIAGKEINIAVASGLSYAHELLEKVKKGEKQYHFIEIMGCRGGCINGGGQPVQSSHIRSYIKLEEMRAKVLYNQDKNMRVRRAHKNESIQMLYKDFLGEPGSHKAHEILHTKFKVREHF